MKLNLVSINYFMQMKSLTRHFIFLVVEEEVGSLEEEAAVVADTQKVVEVGVVGSQKVEEGMDQGQLEEVDNLVVEVEEVEDIHLVAVLMMVVVVGHRDSII
jgi:hypothetical protein